MPRGWSYAYDRRVIELAEARMSIEEAALILDRKPSSVRRMSLRLGVRFKREPKRKTKLDPKDT